MEFVRENLKRSTLKCSDMVTNRTNDEETNKLYTNDTCVNCEGLDASMVFAHLYNTAKPHEIMGKIYEGQDITTKLAQELLDECGPRFDFVNAREFLIDFKHFPLLNTFGYDSKQGGSGTMSRLIDELRMKGEINTNVPRITLVNNVEGKIPVLEITPFLSQSDKVYFVAPFCNELVQLGIPGTHECCEYMGIVNGKIMFNRPNTNKGTFVLSHDQKCIRMETYDDNIQYANTGRPQFKINNVNNLCSLYGSVYSRCLDYDLGYGSSSGFRTDNKPDKPNFEYDPNHDPNHDYKCDEKDIKLVQDQVNCDRDSAICALVVNDQDIVNAIMELTM